MTNLLHLVHVHVHVHHILMGPLLVLLSYIVCVACAGHGGLKRDHRSMDRSSPNVKFHQLKLRQHAVWQT